MSTSHEDQEGPWRELALEHLPCFRDIITASTSHVDMWQDLKDYVIDHGHIKGEEARIEMIFSYAWKCFSQDELHPSIEVAVYFYEDVPVTDGFGSVACAYISVDQLDALTPKLLWHATECEVEAFRSLVCARWRA